MQQLREILQKIQLGKCGFEPESQTQESVRDFQRVANGLSEAKSSGFVHEVKFLRDNRDNKVVFIMAMVIGGLTLTGEQFLTRVELGTEAQPNIPATTMDLFICHSSHDNDASEKFIHLLNSSMDCGAIRIRCTGVPGYGLDAGSNFSDRLAQEVVESESFVVLLSPEAKEKQYVTSELGARWGARKQILPILIKGATRRHLPEIINGLNAIQASSEHDIAQLVREFAALVDRQVNANLEFSQSLRFFCGRYE